MKCYTVVEKWMKCFLALDRCTDSDIAEYNLVNSKWLFTRPKFYIDAQNDTMFTRRYIFQTIVLGLLLNFRGVYAPSWLAFVTVPSPIPTSKSPWKSQDFSQVPPVTWILRIRIIVISLGIYTVIATIKENSLKSTSADYCRYCIYTYTSSNIFNKQKPKPTILRVWIFVITAAHFWLLSQLLPSRLSSTPRHGQRNTLELTEMKSKGSASRV